MSDIIKSLVGAILLTILYLSYSHCGTIDPSVPDSKYIEYAKDFKCIYKICGTYQDGKLFCASAVIIRPHWVLTAAHVVKNAKTCLIHQDDKAFMVDKIIVHNEYEDNIFGRNDIALCHIEKDAELDFYPELYDKDDEVGKICCMAGYGLTGTFLTGIKESDGIKRAGSNYVDSIDRDLLVCSPSLKHKKTELEFLIGSGDSGGGLFIDKKLAGINSCVIAEDKNPNSSYGDESGHTRISKFLPWIKKIID